MKIIIQTPDFKADQTLLDFVTEKVEKLKRFSDEILDANVTLRLDNSDTRENKVCEIRLGIPGNDLYASRQCKTFEEATSKTIDALRSQISSRKG
ncbi:MAG TPA: HPF/RaiA family ribosome-associated protein [Ohtaekwangia sp.]|nr:HPF/RaiA family ribosome-associated protein [Ohtaekwangia sp.]